ncbi:MAG: NADH:ubiquinone reductase (Na(+)-transporting) subunit F, partial [Chloroflexota bacterium]
IKELVLEPVSGTALPEYRPGDYLQLDIPAYPERTLRDVVVDERYLPEWQAGGLFDLRAANPVPARRNYSLATNPTVDRDLRFNVRLATPPRGVDCPAGSGSAYVFGLRPGDIVTAGGPFGEFHVRPGEQEKIYLGGGAGMAPLRAHLSSLLETQRTQARVSYWYGARSLQEAFYLEYFERLAQQHANFSFHLALSEPRPEDAWQGLRGFIHAALLDAYLAQHPDPAAVDYYLCGPPAMIQAASVMLKNLGVPAAQIAYDEY